VPFVDWKKWKAIECEENRRGQVLQLAFPPHLALLFRSLWHNQELGKEREKITSTPEMLDIAFKQ